jgi:hypothetical protein
MIETTLRLVSFRHQNLLPVTYSYEDDNELSGPIKGGEFLE